MKTQLGYKNPALGSSGSFLPIYMCFTVFGILIGFNKAEFKIISLLMSVAISLVIGLLMVRILLLILNSGNPALKKETGNQFARESVSQGMIFVVPFTVLAVLAQVVLGWDTVMAFVSAAVMTAAASAGTEAMKRGARGIKNVILPSLLAFVVSTGWMLIVGLLP